MTRIMLAGATGLIGGQLTALLAEQSAVELHCLVRQLPAQPRARVAFHAGNPAEWPLAIAAVRPDVMVSCLGTTWAKSGKSEAAFRAVDFDLVLSLAVAARAAGARQMITVSSVGASADSRNFYLRTKGEIDDRLAALEFERLDIMRPGLLTGVRGNDRRTGERFGIMLSPLTDLLLHGRSRRYRSIPAITVAGAIAQLALAGDDGRHIHENDAILRLAG